MNIYLNTFGTSLAKENDNFVIIHKDGKQMISPENVKSISISRGAQITSDAALLAIQNEIDVLFVDNKGNPIGRIWSNKFGSITTIRHKQLDFVFSKKAVDWIKEIIMQKFDNQVALLISLVPENHEIQKFTNASINKINDYKRKVECAEGEIVSDISASLRGWEGASSRLYFECLNTYLPDNFKFNSRSQHPAMDVFNALLNYGYGILYGKIEGALIRAGIDPYIGIFHRDDYNRPVLVFDVIEKFRVWVDYVVMNLCMQQAINEDCYIVNSDGSFWLENLGKRILIQSVNDYLNEIILLNGIERSRQTHIDLYAQNLSQQFLKFK